MESCDIGVREGEEKDEKRAEVKGVWGEIEEQKDCAGEATTGGGFGWRSNWRNWSYWTYKKVDRRTKEPITGKKS